MQRYLITIELQKEKKTFLQITPITPNFQIIPNFPIIQIIPNFPIIPIIQIIPNFPNTLIIPITPIPPITKKPRRINLRGFLMKEGGFLLSRIALQYHRRKWA